MKNNQNTDHSNSLPIKSILIPTSAFIFSMSEYFFQFSPAKNLTWAISKSPIRVFTPKALRTLSY